MNIHSLETACQVEIQQPGKESQPFRSRRMIDQNRAQTAEH
jgi:hypothetical protein